MFYQTGNYLLLFCVLFNAMHSSSALYSASGLRGVKMKWNVQNCWVKTTDDTRTTVAKQKTPCQCQWIHIFLNSWDRLSEWAVHLGPTGFPMNSVTCDTHRPFKEHLFSIFIGMNQCRCAKHSFNVHTTPAPMCSVWNVMRHCDIKKKQQHSFYSSRTLSIVIAVIINTMSAQTQTKLTDNK